MLGYPFLICKLIIRALSVVCTHDRHPRAVKASEYSIHILRNQIVPRPHFVHMIIFLYLIVVAVLQIHTLHGEAEGTCPPFVKSKGAPLTAGV